MGSDAGTWYFFSASFNDRIIQARNSSICDSEAYIAVGLIGM